MTTTPGLSITGLDRVKRTFSRFARRCARYARSISRLQFPRHLVLYSVHVVHTSARNGVFRRVSSYSSFPTRNRPPCRRENVSKARLMVWFPYNQNSIRIYREPTAAESNPRKQIRFHYTVNHRGMLEDSSSEWNGSKILYFLFYVVRRKRGIYLNRYSLGFFPRE